MGSAIVPLDRSLMSSRLSIVTVPLLRFGRNLQCKFWLTTRVSLPNGIYLRPTALAECSSVTDAHTDHITVTPIAVGRIAIAMPPNNGHNFRDIEDITSKSNQIKFIMRPRRSIYDKKKKTATVIYYIPKKLRTTISCMHNTTVKRKC